MTSTMRLWLPVWLYMAGIFGLSSLTQTPDLSGGTDKPLHAVLYAGLSVVLIRALAQGRLRNVSVSVALVAVALSTIYALTDELHQGFVPNRQMEARDVVADGLGAMLAAAAAWLAARRSV